MVNKANPELLTIPQAAAYLGTSRQAVWEAVKNGRIKTAAKYGRITLLSRAVLDTYRKTRHPGGPSPWTRRTKPKG